MLTHCLNKVLSILQSSLKNVTFWINCGQSLAERLSSYLIILDTHSPERLTALAFSITLIFIIYHSSPTKDFWSSSHNRVSKRFSLSCAYVVMKRGSKGNRHTQVRRRECTATPPMVSHEETGIPYPISGDLTTMIQRHCRAYENLKRAIRKSRRRTWRELCNMVWKDPWVGRIRRLWPSWDENSSSSILPGTSCPPL